MSLGSFWLILSLLKADIASQIQVSKAWIVAFWFCACYLWSSINWNGLSIVSPTFSIPGIWISSTGMIKNRVIMTRKNLSSTFWLIFSFMDFRISIYNIMFLVSVLSEWRFALNPYGNLDLLVLARRQGPRQGSFWLQPEWRNHWSLSDRNTGGWMNDSCCCF